ncbi:Transposon Ty1-DR2 Gag polyprotein [Bienertia sinuspersici]
MLLIEYGNILLEYFHIIILLIDLFFRALNLDSQFTNTKLENFDGVKPYCTRLKTLADSLKNVGGKVSDNRMALQLLKGLSDEYKAFRTSVRHIKPLPSFDELRSMLELEEQSNASDLADEARETALSAATAPPSPPSAVHPARGNSSRGGGRKPTKGKGKNRGGPNAAQKAAPPRAATSSPTLPYGPPQSSYGPAYMQPPPWAYWAPPAWASPPYPYPTQPWAARPGPQQQASYSGILGPRPKHIMWRLLLRLHLRVMCLLTSSKLCIRCHWRIQIIIWTRVPRLI